MRYAIGPLAAAMIAVSGSAAAAQVGGAQCRDVLNFTGRERSLISWKDEGSEFLKYAASKESSASGSATLPFEIIPVEFGFDFDESKQKGIEKMSEWRKSYFSDVMRVFEPSVWAWRECIRAANSGARVEPHIDQSGNLNVTIVKPSGFQGYLGNFGFNRSAIGCTSGGRALGPRSRIRLPDGPLVIFCKRLPTKNAAENLTFSVGPNVFNIPLPQLAGDLRRYGGNNDQIELVQGCGRGTLKNFPSANFDRMIRLEDSRMLGSYGNNSSYGFYNVLVNGRVILSGRTNRQDDWDPRGIFSISGTDVFIPAFLPFQVEAFGGVEGGSCEQASTTVKIPSEPIK